MKELKIGEEIRIRCVEGVAYSCRDCAIGKIVDNPHCANLCSPTYRTDGKNVHFEIVENPHKELIDKACEWFKKHYREYVLGGEDMIADFRKAMED